MGKVFLGVQECCLRNLYFRGTFHYHSERIQRQYLLKTYFGLACKCKACRGLIPEDDAGFPQILAYSKKIRTLLNLKIPLNYSNYEKIVSNISQVEALSAKVLILKQVFAAFFDSQI